MAVGETPGQPRDGVPLPLDHPDFWTVLLTVAQVSQRLGLSRAKTFTLISDGSIPSRKIGSARRVLLGDLARYIAVLGEPVIRPTHTQDDQRGDGVG